MKTRYLFTAIVLAFFNAAFMTNYALPDDDKGSVTVDVTLNPDECVLATSSDTEKFTDTITISATVTGEPDYDKEEFIIKKEEWKFSIAADGCLLEPEEGSKLDEWQTAASATCKISSTSAGTKGIITGTAEKRYTFDKKNATSPEPPDAVTFSGTANEVPRWTVGVKEILYKLPSEPESAYRSPVGKLSVLNKESLDFKAIPDPEDAPYWSIVPSWSVTIDSDDPIGKGAGETNSIQFELPTDLDVPNPTTSQDQTIKAKSGASEVSLVVEVFVYKIHISAINDGDETADTDSTSLKYGKPASITISRDRADGELIVSIEIITTKEELGIRKRPAVQGKDFEVPSTTVTFTKGKLVSEPLLFPVVDDKLFEGDEYFLVKLKNNNDKYTIVGDNTEDDQVTGEDVSPVVPQNLIKIVDNDKLELQKVIFKDVSEMTSDPINDSGKTISWGKGPHWVKDKILNADPNIGYVPVLYNGGNTLKVEAFFNGQIDTDLKVSSKFTTTINGNEVKSDTITLSNAGGDLVKGIYTSQTSFENRVIIDPSFSINFQVATNKNNIKDAGTSVSCLYVSLKKSLSGSHCHSVVHNGCVAANGATDNDAVFDAIWALFKGNDTKIKRFKIDNGLVVDGENLLYYGIQRTYNPNVDPAKHGNVAPTPSAPNNQYSLARNKEVYETDKLLLYHDGKCGAWARLFKDIVAVHGVHVDVTSITISSDRKYRNLSVFAVYADTGKHHGVKPLERSWGDHAIIKYGKKYFDSSYGEVYGVKDECKAKFLEQTEGFYNKVTSSWTKPSTIGVLRVSP